MELKLDLHVHSDHSPDGKMTLQEIKEACKAAGLNGCAICDHDRVFTDSVEDDSGFLVIPGVEISTEFGHLLGLFVCNPIDTKSFYEAVQCIHEQGGLAVLAHPFEHRSDPAQIEPLVPFLDGVEVWNSRADRKNKQANIMAKQFADFHHLCCFAGSDAHVPKEIGNTILSVETDACTPDSIKSALKMNKVQITGKRSPARYTAASQLTKRQKCGASPAAYIKWGLFAAKCLVQDLMNKGE